MKWGDLGGVQLSISHPYRGPSYLSSLESLCFQTIFSYVFFEQLRIEGNEKLKSTGNFKQPC